MTPFEALRAALRIAAKETEVFVVSPDGITQLKLIFEPGKEPGEEKLTIESIKPEPRRVPRISTPVITQTELNGRVWLKSSARDVIEAATFGELAAKIDALPAPTGFSIHMLVLMRQAAGDPNFEGFFERV